MLGLLALCIPIEIKQLVHQIAVRIKGYATPQLTIP